MSSSGLGTAFIVQQLNPFRPHFLYMRLAHVPAQPYDNSSQLIYNTSSGDELLIYSYCKHYPPLIIVGNK